MTADRRAYSHGLRLSASRPHLFPSPPFAGEEGPIAEGEGE